ncbi:MAG: hypothetical protein GXX96_11705 [Planctomycetaceae bacterium]|nr:hypothetical protein [Planctomycetaceae bacterium]
MAHRQCRAQIASMFGQVVRFGHRDGSGVHRVAQRLESRAKEDPQLDRRLKSLIDCPSSLKR